LFTNNGGERWEVRESPDRLVVFSDILYLNEEEVFGVSDGIWKSEDSGIKWSKIEETGNYFDINESTDKTKVFFVGGKLGIYKVGKD